MKKVLLVLTVALFTFTSCEKEELLVETCGCVFLRPAEGINSFSLLHDTEEITDCNRDGEVRWGEDNLLYELECQTLPFNWDKVIIFPQFKNK